MEAYETAQEEAVTVPARPCEDVLVLQWRHECCCKLGFDDDESSALAGDLSVDLELLRRLVKAGCPLALAKRIV